MKEKNVFLHHSAQSFSFIKSTLYDFWSLNTGVSNFF